MCQGLVGSDSGAADLEKRVRAGLMRRLDVYRLLSVLNRCMLGGCLLVSFTASASVDATRGFSIATYRPPLPRITSLNPDQTETEDVPLIIIPGQIGLGPEFSRDGSTSPRYQAKTGVILEPRVNTLGKGDPLPALVRGAGEETPGPSQSAAMVMSNEPMIDRTVPPQPFAKAEPAGLMPRAEPAAITSPDNSANTLAIALILHDFSQTMAANERRLAASSVLAKIVPPVRPADPHPNIASLLTTAELDKEQRCLAEAVYFEARSEPEQGQAAVAQVVLNRLKSKYYPKTICEVVYQNQERFLGCEFTFTCEGKSLVVTEPESWSVAVRLARQVMEGAIYNPDVGDSTHYHADYVRPYWANALEKRDVIGRHIFYSLKPGLPGGVCPGCLLAKAAG